MLFTVVWRSDYEGRQITACQAQIQFMLGEIYRWISKTAALPGGWWLCAVGRPTQKPPYYLLLRFVVVPPAVFIPP
jgi:hypothetical protein